jgi:CHAT domain-containing protein/predicted negative regulator of RcsB-dependent stress response
MKKTCQFLFCCLVVFGGIFDLSVKAHGSDDLTTISTVNARRDKLSQLLTERNQSQAQGDRRAVVQLTNQISELYLKLCELNAALRESQESLRIARSMGSGDEGRLLVDTLSLAARVHINRTENPSALLFAGEALTRSRELQYRSGEAECDLLLAEAYFELDRRDEAGISNDRALQIWREVQDKRGEGLSLVMQGDLLMMSNKPAEAAVAFKSAEVIWRDLGDPVELATSLVDQNFLAIRQGQFQNALVLLSEARSLLVEAEAEPYLAAKIANSFGEIYEAYGQLDTALSYFLESLSHFRDGAHDVKGTVTAGIKVARVQASLGKFDQALQLTQQSLAAAIVTDNALTIGLCHEDLGRVWLQAGSYEPARLEFLSAISSFTRSKSDRPLARAHMYLGQAEHLLGNLERAGEAYEAALHFFIKNSDYTNEAALRFGLGKLALQQGRTDRAERELRRSIELTERLRENASSKELRSSFLHSVHDRYETYVEWLMTRYDHDRNKQYAVEAFEAAEAGRARALLDSLDGYQRELRQPSDPFLLLEEEELQKREQQLIDYRDSQLSRSGAEKDRVDIEQKLRAVRAQIETVAARINSSARFDDLLRPTPLTYQRIRTEIADSKTSLVFYSLGEAKSFAWVVTKDELNTYELPDKTTIEQAANKLIELIKAPPTSVSEQSQLQNAIDDVSRLVVEPLSPKLQTSRLIIIADGILQYVPFQILKTSGLAGEMMISRFDIIDAPSASAFAAVRRERLRRQPGSKLLIGFGDAVFSSEYAPHPTKADTSSSLEGSRAGSRFRDLPRLFYAQRELRAIGELAGSDSAIYVEYDATRARFLSVDLSQFRIVHVVTHGVLDDKHPELSGLVLSLVDGNAQPIDGFVSLADIYRLHAPVDLVVLSACHTALGQQLRGEGLIGLTRGFMYAGASGVVASLWKVDDRATAELMKHFYANMLQRGMGPAAALRTAQNEIRSQAKWSAPYYWAGFTFQGDYDLTISPPQPISYFNYKWLMLGIAGVLLLAVAYVFQRGHRKRIATRC